MLMKKNETNVDKFWQDYEEKTGEKILAHSLGQYFSGWEEFDSQGWTGIWGLLIATSGGFRFHHFPKISWLESFTSFAGREAPKEKTLFIHMEKIVSVQIKEESKWWKKLLTSSCPQLTIIYRDGMENERQLLLEIHIKPHELVSTLAEKLKRC